MNGAKKALLLNIVLLAAVALLAVTATFAWFFLVRDTPAKQTVKLGSFRVAVHDTVGEFSQTEAVDLPLTIPMRYGDALTASGHVYTFEVYNGGTVSAMYRFARSIKNDTILNGKGIGEFVRCAVRSARSYEGLASEAYYGGLSEEALWLDPVTEGKRSLIDYLDSVMLEDAKDESGAAVGKRGSAAYALDAGGARYFQLLVWLDENTTVEDVGADYDYTVAGSEPRLTFDLTVYAMQYYGAYWESGWSAA